MFTRESLKYFTGVHVNNSLHLTRKYGWIFVRGPYLLRHANSFKFRRVEDFETSTYNLVPV